MREERVIALAGMFQAIALVRAIALRGGADTVAMQPSIASVFKIDAESPADVFGGIGNLRLGFETLIAQLDDKNRDLAMTRIAISVLRLQRKVTARPRMLASLREGIDRVAAQTPGMQPTDAVVIGRLAKLYADTISQLQPRVLVEGNPQFLSQDNQAAQIRALLFGAIRAAVLWHQLGGTQWRLLFRRRQYAMMARGQRHASAKNDSAGAKRMFFRRARDCAIISGYLPRHNSTARSSTCPIPSPRAIRWKSTARSTRSRASPSSARNSTSRACRIR
jgi:high frequency lysogenization protein